MSISNYDEPDAELDEAGEPVVSAEACASKKLERRRKIEDFFEERRMKEELSEFA
jgi:hypothetical protein